MIELGGYQFRYKKDVAAKARAIIHNREPVDQAFLLALVSGHPHFADKKGCGIARIEVARDTCCGANCLWIVRTDGTRVDFSYKTCLTPPSVASSLRNALRNEIIYQIVAFKHAHLGELCPYTGEVVTCADAHVDHAPPEFADLMKRWLAGRTPAVIDDHSKAGSREQLACEADRASWREFHQQNASLVLCTKSGHECRHRSKQPLTTSTLKSP